jgi:pimeloyl-ACP methyl ester carboxylesterase
VPYVRIATPLSPGDPIDQHYRDEGRGEPLLILHGGWGAAFYPFDAALAELGGELRFLTPDRTGYGRSPRIPALPPRFHEVAAIEVEAFLDALGIGRCAIWGHSDGAVIAAIAALRRPDRYRAIILEALHLDREKPASRAFFTMMAEAPDGFGPRVAARLAADHGPDDWRHVLRIGGRAWLAIAGTPGDDFYGHRLPELRVPALVLHGADDPRTEPGELDRLRREVPTADIRIIPGGGHSPHSERATAATATAIAAAFLRVHIEGGPKTA